jgi:hypothetical protein
MSTAKKSEPIMEGMRPRSEKMRDDVCSDATDGATDKLIMQSINKELKTRKPQRRKFAHSHFFDVNCRARNQISIDLLYGRDFRRTATARTRKYGALLL